MTSTADGHRDAPLRVPAASLWRNRDYLLLWSGQGISSLGGQISGIAIPLLVLALTNSPAQAGFIGAISGIPYLLFSLPAGVLVDRWNRKYIMIICEVGRALNIASIPLAAAFGHLTILQLYANAAVKGTLFVVFNVAEVASLTRVVGKEQLAGASAQNEALTNAASLGGPPIGGLIYQTLGRTIPFAIDAISYAASVVSLALMKTRFQEERSQDVSSLLGEIREGIRWFWRQPFIRFSAIRSGVTNFVFNGTYLILIVLAKQRHADPGLIGLMLALGSLGGLFGTFPATRLQRRFSGGIILIAVAWIEAALYPLFAIVPTVILLGVVYALIIVSIPTSNAVVLSHRLALIPDHLQGRVNSAVRMITYGGAPLGTAAAGVLLQTMSGATVVLIFAAIMIAVAVATTFNPHVRNLQPISEALSAQ